jgi:glucosamine kinase
MHVIGEVGGSSSRWAFLAQDGTFRILPTKGERLPGFNPLSGDGTVFAQGLREQFEGTAAEGRTVTEVTIYGAGCGTEERKQRMQAAVRTLWPEPHITVGTDLLGAALGLCAPEQGLVLILGTGMNTGYFDGQRLHCPMPSLGYILGDDASGADIGRNLLQDAFYGRIPEQLHLALFGVEGPDLDGVLERIHRGPYPARELASYTVRIAGTFRNRTCRTCYKVGSTPWPSSSSVSIRSSNVERWSPRDRWPMVSGKCWPNVSWTEV